MARNPPMAADDLIRLLGLQPHPEGGFYQETYRETGDGGERGAVTAIYFLLRAGERSHWHQVDATEIWFWHGGASVELAVAAPDPAQVPAEVLTAGAPQTICLGGDFAAGERPQGVVPPHWWQSARSLGGAHDAHDWSLVSCVVAPAFQFSGFKLAPTGWEPPGK